MTVRFSRALRAAVWSMMEGACQSQRLPSISPDGAGGCRALGCILLSSGTDRLSIQVLLALLPHIVRYGRCFADCTLRRFDAGRSSTFVYRLRPRSAIGTQARVGAVLERQALSTTQKCQRVTRGYEGTGKFVNGCRGSPWQSQYSAREVFRNRRFLN